MKFRITKVFGRYLPYVSVLDPDYPGVPNYIRIGQVFGYSTVEGARGECVRYNQEKREIIVDEFEMRD